MKMEGVDLPVTDVSAKATTMNGATANNKSAGNDGLTAIIVGAVLGCTLVLAALIFAIYYVQSKKNVSLHMNLS